LRNSEINNISCKAITYSDAPNFIHLVYV